MDEFCTTNRAGLDDVIFTDRDRKLDDARQRRGGITPLASCQSTIQGTVSRSHATVCKTQNQAARGIRS